MVLTLAFRNLVHDRMRLALTLLGIGISIVLIGAQMGLMLGFSRMISGVLDHAKVDLWVVPAGTAAFDDPALLDMSERYSALAITGVESVTPMVVGFADWKMSNGGTATVILLGSDFKAGTLAPWNISSGTAAQLRAPETVAIDQAYSQSLGVTNIGDVARIEGKVARVAAITTGIRSFTTSPYVFTGLDQAQEYLSIPYGRTTYLAVKLASGADIETVRKRMSARIKRSEVLTTQEFRDRNFDRWMFSTGAGAALLSGILLGLCVGAFIVAQTLYASINDHLSEFATLRAMGSSKGFLRKVIFCQAGLSAVFASMVAAAGVASLVAFTAGSALPIAMTPVLGLLLLILSLLMSFAAAAMTVAKVTRIQPVTVFSR